MHTQNYEELKTAPGVRLVIMTVLVLPLAGVTWRVIGRENACGGE